MDFEVLHLACCTTTTGHNFWIGMYGLPERYHPLARTSWWWSSDPARSEGGRSGRHVLWCFWCVFFESWHIESFVMAFSVMYESVWCSHQESVCKSLPILMCYSIVCIIWVFPKIGVKPPKWMVKIMVPNPIENYGTKPIKMGWFGGYKHPYSWKHPFQKKRSNLPFNAFRMFSTPEFSSGPRRCDWRRRNGCHMLVLCYYIMLIVLYIPP